jgi:hypothetical protein
MPWVNAVNGEGQNASLIGAVASPNRWNRKAISYKASLTQE